MGSDSGFKDLSYVSSTKHRYLGVSIKNEFGVWQFISIPALSTATIMIGVYLNAQMAYMLEDKTMFNAPADQIGTLTSQLTTYSLPFSIVMTFFVSYLFEIIGRRLTIFFSYLLTAGIFFLIPYTAPSFNWLLTLRVLIGVTMAAPISHPLIPDYVKRNSRGAAIAIAGVGFVFGEVISMGILFNLTKNMSYFSAFAIVATVILMFSILFFFIIVDPDFDNIR